MSKNTSAPREVLDISPGIGKSTLREKTSARYRIHAGLLVFSASDFLTVVFSGILAKLIYLDYYLDTEQTIHIYLLIALLLGFILILVNEQMGLYKVESAAGRLVGFGALWGGLLVSFLVLIGILYLLKIAGVYSRGWVLTWLTISAPMLVFVRWRLSRSFRRRMSEGLLSHPLAVYGAPEQILRFNAEYDRNGPFGTVEGVYAPRSEDAAAIGADGDLDDLRKAMSLQKFDTIIIALPPEDRAGIQTAVKCLASYSAELLLCSDLEKRPWPVSGSRSHGSLRFDAVNIAPSSEYSRFAKPMLDYALAAAGVIALAPVFLLIALAIKLDSPGPVFFRQRRYGRNNRIFRIYKFRTMTVAEDGAVVVQATRNDARVTRVGRFLRRSSLDEIPQLFNVLLGDMSIVGPRPHAIAHDDAFEEKLDLFSRRRRVRPGITGWAQVNGFRGETKTIDDIRGRMQHDMYYIDNWSIWLDLEIIARTVLVAGRRAY